MYANQSLKDTKDTKQHTADYHVNMCKMCIIA